MKIPQADHSPLLSAVGTVGNFQQNAFREQSRQIDKAYAPIEFGLGLAKGALEIAQGVDKLLYQKERADATQAALTYEQQLRANVENKRATGGASYIDVPTFDENGAQVGTHKQLNWSEDFKKTRDDAYNQLTGKGGPITRSDVQAELRARLDTITQQVTGQATAQAMANLYKENAVKLYDQVQEAIAQDSASNTIVRFPGDLYLPAKGSQTEKVLNDAAGWANRDQLDAISRDLPQMMGSRLLYDGVLKLAAKGDLATAQQAIENSFKKGTIDPKQREAMMVQAAQEYVQANSALKQKVDDIKKSGDPTGTKLLALKDLAGKVAPGWRSTVQDSVDSTEKEWLGDVFSQRYSPMIGFTDENLAQMRAYKAELQGDVGLNSYGNNQDLREKHIEQLTQMIGALEGSRSGGAKATTDSEMFKQIIMMNGQDLTIPRVIVERKIKEYGDRFGLEDDRATLTTWLKNWRDQSELQSPGYTAFRDGDGGSLKGWLALEKEGKFALAQTYKNAAMAAISQNPQLQPDEVFKVLRAEASLAASTDLFSFARASSGIDPRAVGGHSALDESLSAINRDWNSKTDDALNIQFAQKLEILYPGIKIDRKADGSVVTAPVESSPIHDIVAGGLRYRPSWDEASQQVVFDIIDDKKGTMTRGRGTNDLKQIAVDKDMEARIATTRKALEAGQYATEDLLLRNIQFFPAGVQADLKALWQQRYGANTARPFDAAAKGFTPPSASGRPGGGW